MKEKIVIPVDSKTEEFVNAYAQANSLSLDDATLLLIKKGIESINQIQDKQEHNQSHEIR